jgi:hypothetical protein
MVEQGQGHLWGRPHWLSLEVRPMITERPESNRPFLYREGSDGNDYLTLQHVAEGLE